MEQNLFMEGDEIIISGNEDVDLALIPIKEEERLHFIAAEVSKTSPEETEKVIGTNYHKGTYCECSILSVKRFVGNIYPILTTNCPGKGHYSGTGYFNSDGLLTAVHKGGKA